MICQIFSCGIQARVANRAGFRVEGPRHLSMHTHAPCTASKTHPQPVRDISATAASAHPTDLSWPDSKSPKVSVLWHRIMAGVRPDIDASPTAAGSWAGSIRPWYQWMQREHCNPQMGFTFHCRVILPGDWARDLYHSEFYLQIGKWQCVL